MNSLEEKLALSFNKKYCIFTGSGTSAIYIILKALKLQHKKVLYPAITCTTPVNAAIYAGYKPIFCDINLNNYTMDIASIEFMIRTNDVGIIVPTHIYGHKCNMEKIMEIAKENNIFVLEDAAQTTELSTADVSIMSFGHTKILECNSGGGAIFTDDEQLYFKIKEEIGQLPTRPLNLKQLFDEYRKSYYDIINKISDESQRNKELFKLQMTSRDSFIYHLSNNNKLIDILDKKNEVIEKRIKRASLYESFLDKQLLDAPQIHNNTVRWRYSFLFNGNREELFEKVRKNNVDISGWYNSLHKIYSNQDDKYFCNSNYLQNHIVNLWLTPNYTEEKILKDITIINNVIKGVV